MNAERTKIAQRAGLTGIACNLLLFVLKLLVGITANAVSITADAFNNLTDAGSSVISLIGSRMAGKEADEAHPFGHGRIEYIAAFVVAFLVIQVGFSVFRDSLGKLLHQEALHFSYVSVFVLLLSIAGKLWMSWFYRTIAKKIDSSVYAAAASDSLSDVLTTAAALVSLLAYGMFQVNIDGVIGLVVSVIVMYNGICIAKDTLKPLIGEPAPQVLVQRIQDFVEQYDGIVGTHDLIVHNYGPKQYMATIHAEVPRERDIELSHDIVDKIERDARSALGIVLVIHMDPVDVKDETLNNYRRLLSGVLKQVDERLRFHDFRVLHSESGAKLIFDLVTPWEYTEEEENTAMLEICRLVKEKNPQLACVISAEKSYVQGTKEGGATRMDAERPENEA